MRFAFFRPIFTPSQGWGPSQSRHSFAFVKIPDNIPRRSERVHQLKPSQLTIISFVVFHSFALMWAGLFVQPRLDHRRTDVTKAKVSKGWQDVVVNLKRISLSGGRAESRHVLIEVPLANFSERNLRLDHKSTSVDGRHVLLV